MSFLVNTGATKSSVRATEVPNLPLSGEKVQVVGITSETQLNDVTAPIPVKIGPVRKIHQFVICDSSPVNILGRDLLCQLNCTIHCTPDGVILATHDEDAEFKISSQSAGNGFYVLLTI